MIARRILLHHTTGPTGGFGGSGGFGVVGALGCVASHQRLAIVMATLITTICTKVTWSDPSWVVANGVGLDPTYKIAEV